MAGACASSIPLVSASSACPCPSKKTCAASRFRPHTVSCRATGGGSRGDNKDGLLWLPRRDVLLNGLSSVAAAGLAWYPAGVASGADDAPCTRADKVNDRTVQCTDPAPGQQPCPLASPTAPVVDFTPESRSNKAATRVRQAAHLLSRENQEKYKEAVAKMKALPESNPLSFAAQAAIHEAYCDAHYRYETAATAGAGKQEELPFDVHFSWIFAPWHRMYVYFYERALGELIGDDTFALPFWNWDAPAGMVVPPLFRDSPATNPLHDPNRNPAHLDALVDLDYLNDRDAQPIPFNGPHDEKYKELVNKNLCTVYTQQVRSGKGAESFLGEKYCTGIGSSKTSAGTLERMAHTAMHVWVGKAGPTPPAAACSAATGGVPNHTKGGYSCQNDMGFLGTAGRDPLFYSHHANVDRMWHLWSTRLGGGQVAITDPDWLDASFVFYDGVESPRKVRIKFSDVLDTRNLGYTYDAGSDRDLPWLRPKIASLVPHGKGTPPTPRRPSSPPAFPLALAKGKVVEVPGVAVPAKEPGKEQLLEIEGIEYDPQANNRFDVAINVPADKASRVGPQYKEYAGSFAAVPSSGAGGGSGTTTRQGKVSLCITEVLFDIEADGDSTVDVVIVPRTDAKVTLNVRPTIKNRN